MTKLERTMKARMPKQMSILRFEFRVSSFFRHSSFACLAVARRRRVLRHLIAKLSTPATVSIRAGSSPRIGLVQWRFRRPGDKTGALFKRQSHCASCHNRRFVHSISVSFVTAMKNASDLCARRTSKRSTPNAQRSTLNKNDRRHPVAPWLPSCKLATILSTSTLDVGR